MKGNLKRPLHLLAVLVLMLIGVVFYVPVLAQTEADEPAPTAAATQTASDDGGDTTGANDGIPWDVVVPIIAAFAAGGVTIPRLVKYFTSDPKAMQAGEERINRLPEALTNAANKVAEGVESIAVLTQKLTDRVPEASKPPETPDYSKLTDDALLDLFNQRLLLRKLPEDTLLSEMSARGWSMTKFPA